MFPYSYSSTFTYARAELAKVLLRRPVIIVAHEVTVGKYSRGFPHFPTLIEGYMQIDVRHLPLKENPTQTRIATPTIESNKYRWPTSILMLSIRLAKV